MKKFSLDLQKYYEHYAPARMSTCSFLIEGEKSEHNYPAAPCHASCYPGNGLTLRDVEKNIHLVIYSGTDKKCHDYLEWICGPNSPWKALFDANSVFRAKNGNIIGVSIYDVQNKPFGLFMNFTFASRFHDEFHNSSFQTFLAARKAGLSHAQSFVVAHCFKGEPEQLVWCGGAGWHAALDTYQHSPVSIARLEKGDALQLNIKYSQGRSVHNGSINSIWLKPEKPPKVTLFNLKANDLDKPLYKGSFQKMYSARAYDFNDVFGAQVKTYSLKTLVERQEDWYC